MTTNIGSLAVSLSLDASNFNGSVEQVNRNLGAMASELKASKALGSDYGKSVEGLASKKDILSRSVEASSAKLKIERERYDELAASGKANEIELERQAKRVNEAQAQYNRLSTELASVDKQLKIQSSSWTQYGEKMEAAGKKMQTIGKGMTDVGDKLTKSVTLPLVGLGTGAFKAAVDFESAFAGVRKTVDASEAEFAALSDGIRNMAKEIPAAATEIAGVAEAAGQLGIEKESILGFTRTMVDLGVATNMTSDEAATALARLANITQMNQQDFDKLGSSVVALGNNFATTEREIVDMALRLAGAGAQVGMSEADILALSAALSSVGIEAEMGGSAISRVMVNMQVATSAGFSRVQELSKKTGMSLRDLQMMASHNSKGFGKLAESLGMTKKELTNLINAGVDLEGFSKVAGMTGEQFKQAFEKDAIGALGAFINGLANAEEAGESAINMLQEMGITEIRLRDSLLRAGGAAELFAGAVDLSNEAWDENNALTKEAEERYKTTASQMKILWNRITDIGISFGEILIPMAQEGMDKIGGLVDKFASLDKNQQKNIIKMAAWAAAAGPVLSTTGRLTTSFGNLLLIGGTLAKGIGGAGGLAASLGAVAGPGAIAVGALVAVGAAGYGLYKVLNETSIPEIDIFGETVSDNTKKAVGAFAKLTDEASVQLGLLKASGMTVSEEMAGNMIGTFSQMSETILADMKEDHAAQMEAARTHMAATVNLSEEEQAKLLSVVEEGQKERESRIENLQRQYNSIIQNASDERRKTTTEENRAIAQLQAEMKETGIRYLSETESEALVILERLKLESGKINAEQALETSKRARESKEAVIEEAEQKYDETLKWARFLKEDGSKESLELYESIVKDAENTRDETIKAAEGQYEEVIRITKEKGDEYVTETELRLGRVMTAWEKLSVEVGFTTMTLTAKVVSNLRQMATDGGKWFIELRKDGITSATELARGYSLAVNKLPGVVRKILIDAVAEVGKSVLNFYNAGKDAAQGVIDGWKSKAVDIAVETSKTGLNMIKAFDKAIGRQSPAKEFIKAAEDAGRGIVVGLRNSDSKISQAVSDTGRLMVDILTGSAKVLSAAARNNAAEIAKINEQAETDRIAVQQDAAKKREEIERKSSQSIETILATSKNKKGQITESGSRRIHNTRQDAAAKLEKLEADSAEKIVKINEKATADIAKKEGQLSKERLDALKSYVADKKSLDELSLVAESEVWRKALALFKEGTKERIEVQKGYQASLKAIDDEIVRANDEYAGKIMNINNKLADGIKEINDDLAKKVTNINTKLNDDILKAKEELASKSKSINDRLIADQLRVNEEYAKAYDDQYNKLLNFAGLFDKFDATPKESGEQLLANLQSQVDGFKDWEEEIDKLSSKAIDEGLIAELKAMGPKALPQLLALNEMTDEQLSNYSALYREKAALARAETDKEMAAMKADTQRRLSELRSVANSELAQLNADTYARINEMRRIADSEIAQLKTDAHLRITEMRITANEQLDLLKTEWVEKINGITKATDDELQSLKQIGVNAGQRLLDGLASMEGALVAKATSIASAVNAALQSALGGSVNVPMTSSTNSLSGGRSTGNQTSSTGMVVNQQVVINSPKALSPSETARQNKRAAEELALAWR